MCNQEPTCHVCGMLLAKGQTCPKCGRPQCKLCIEQAITTTGLCAQHAGMTYAIRITATDEFDADGNPYAYLVGQGLTEDGPAFASADEAQAALAGLTPSTDDVCIVCAEDDVMACNPYEVTVVRVLHWRLTKV